MNTTAKRETFAGTAAPDSQLAWIAVDWGTSNLRVWAMDGSGRVIMHHKSDKGMMQLDNAQFEPALLEVVEDILTNDRVTPVIVCGMAGARHGWTEAPYSAVPCNPFSAPKAIRVPVRDHRITVHILPGLFQAEPPDVMRGEETQILGYLREFPDFTGATCLPGTHTKWVQVENGKIVEFSTSMTGEIFALLSESSVLRHVGGADGWDDGEFTRAVEEAADGSKSFAVTLFRIRAQALVSDLSPSQARARLSGLLIGWEISGARSLWRNRPVVIIGEAKLSSLYLKALEQMGAKPTLFPNETATLTGLSAAFHILFSEGSVCKETL